MTGITCADAEYLSGIPASTWRRWVSEGRIDATTIKGRLRIDAKQAMSLAKRREARDRLPSAF